MKATTCCEDAIFEALRGHYCGASPTLRRAGEAWYERANAQCELLSLETGLRVDVIAGVFAVTSPMSSWAEQLRYVPRLLRAYKAGVPLSDVRAQCFSQNKRKAESLLRGEDFDAVAGGRKVRSFRRNLLLDPGPVTVDGWMVRAAFGLLGDDTTNRTPGVRNVRAPLYDAIEAATALLAREHGCLPYQAQATVWLSARAACGYHD